MKRQPSQQGKTRKTKKRAPPSRSTRGDAFAKLCDTIAALRHPETGCPWDLEQTHATLRRYMVEEAYEAAAVMDPLDAGKLCDELGDVLLQVILNAHLASEAGAFAVEDVIAALDAKMRRRHPHVFSAAPGERASKTQVEKTWQDIKRSEVRSPDGTAGYFGNFESGTKGLPALMHAQRIGDRAKRIAFDWSSLQEVQAQFTSEVRELEEAVDALTGVSGSTTGKALGEAGRHAVREELGDVAFTFAQLCRHFDCEAEIVAFEGSRKFLRRFRRLEDVAREHKLDVEKCSTAELESLWIEAKGREKRESNL